MSKNKKRLKNKIDTSLGGKALAAGGFGCVFDPPLKCKGEARPTGNVVSKLLRVRHANTEFKEATDIQEMLRTNLGDERCDKYYIFPKKKCEPDNLTHTDLINFHKICGPVCDQDSDEDINDEIELFRIIEFEHGGSSLVNFVRKRNKTPDELTQFNKSAVNLLVDAIVPMNKLNIVHFDLKPGNILMDADNRLRIIDWGLSFIIKDHNNVTPKAKNRPFMSNSPFGVAIFNTDKIKQIDEHLGTLTFGNDYKSELKEQISENFKMVYAKYNGIGVLGHSVTIIINNITQIVIDFVNPKTKKFEAERYFHEVFIKNCDIWGFLTCYSDLVKRSPNLNAELKEGIKQLLHKYLYSCEYASKPIDVDKLVGELKKLIPFKIEKTIKSTGDDSSILPPPPPLVEKTKSIRKTKRARKTKIIGRTRSVGKTTSARKTKSVRRNTN